jgi:hypothetical protein
MDDVERSTETQLSGRKLQLVSVQHLGGRDRTLWRDLDSVGQEGGNSKGNGDAREGCRCPFEATNDEKNGM